MSDIRAECNLSDEDFEARRKELRERLVPRVRARAELADGVALLFDATPELRRELDAFVEFERKCCSGLGFEVSESGSGLRLEIHGVDPSAAIFAGMGATEGAGR